MTPTMFILIFNYEESLLVIKNSKMYVNFIHIPIGNLPHSKTGNLINYQMRTSEKSINLTKVRTCILYDSESKNLTLTTNSVCVLLKVNSILLIRFFPL